MKKISLLHCYSDQNRGDAGIIIATIDLIKNRYPDAEINLHSTFRDDDDRFKSCHFATSCYADNTYPAVFPEPHIEKDGREKSNIKKTFRLLQFSFSSLVLLILPKSKLVRNILFSDLQRQAIEKIEDSDLVISKGGSFLYALGGITGTAFLARMLYPFWLAKKLKIKTIIFAQSIGPYSSPCSSYLAAKTLKNIDLVFLRELKCLEYITLPAECLARIKKVPDAAFYLSSLTSNSRLASAEDHDIKIGITVRPYTEYDGGGKKEFAGYIQAIVEVVVALYEKYEGSIKFYFFSQVTGPSNLEDDGPVTSALFKKIIDTIPKLGGSCILVEEMNLPQQYKHRYAEMDFMICTRLHSAIFALSAGVPVLNISYHGTKSQGILGDMGMAEFVFDINNMNSLKMVSLITNNIRSERLIIKIMGAVSKNRAALEMAISEALQ